MQCKWSGSNFDPANLQAFLRQYPQGEGIVVARDVKKPFQRRYGGIPVKFLSLSKLIEDIRTHRRQK